MTPLLPCRPARIGMAVALLTLLVGQRALALPFAVDVRSYVEGRDTGPAFRDPNAALGAPAQETGFGDVTPFNAPFTGAALVQIGPGGELVVHFDHRIEDDPRNPFGIDLLVFGNAFFFNPDFTGPVLALDVFAEAGDISVSQTGQAWIPIPGVSADGLFPTQGYTDSSGPFTDDGRTPADFTRPVDPALDWLGRSFDEIVALYAGAGGGTGIDLAVTGLPWIQLVRISLPSDAPGPVEIDAFADVAAPEPASVLLSVGLAALALRRFRLREARRSARH
ncbi:MAG: hypothetical protein ACE5FG_01995 [Myxococcota bacterium]